MHLNIFISLKSLSLEIYWLPKQVCRIIRYYQINIVVGPSNTAADLQNNLGSRKLSLLDSTCPVSLVLKGITMSLIIHVVKAV